MRFLPNISLRSLLLRLLARLSFLLPVALLCALVYELWQGAGLPAWGRAFLLLLPLSLSYYAALGLRSLWQFALVSLLLGALGWLLAGHPGGAGVILFCCLLRGRARVFEETQPAFLERPTLWFQLVFAGVFLTGAFLAKPLLQRLAVLSAVLSLLIFLLFRALSRLDAYLRLNREISGLPARRIRRWVGGALAAAVVFSLILLLPGLLSVRGELILTVPQKALHSTATPEPDFFDANAVSGAARLGEIFGGQETREFHGEFLFFLVILLVSAFALVVLIRVLRQFRGAFHDARDTVQYLSREEGEDRIQRSRRVGRLSLLDRSPNGSIRRLYRKEIRRGLTEAPAPWQSPSEIEADASLSDPELHALYEKARYGPQPCTPEDLRRLKRSR